MSNYIDEYEECRHNTLEYLRGLKDELAVSRNRYNKLKDKNDTSKDLRSYQLSILRRLYIIADTEEELLFLRPKNDEDIAYRHEIITGSFCNKLCDIVPDELPLCFHGTPIHRSKSIITSGIISSSVDRLGFETSTNNVSNQISVTTKDSIRIVINYANLNLYDYPAGCIFVILPTTEAEIKSSKSFNCISNVNFKENPNLLFAIITTPENIEQVEKWGREIGISSNKVYDFYGFIDMLKKKKADEVKEAYIEYLQENKKNNNK